jgi:hypothetical protein
MQFYRLDMQKYSNFSYFVLNVMTWKNLSDETFKSAKLQKTFRRIPRHRKNVVINQKILTFLYFPKTFPGV